MNCRKTNVLPTSCVCGGMRSSRPTGAVQKEFARPRERRGAAMLPRAFVQGQKTGVHAPGFLEFAKQIPLNMCTKRTKKGTPKACLSRFRAQVRRNAIPCRIPAVPEQAGQAHRSAPHKIPRKSRGVYLTFTPLPAPYPRAPSLAPSGQFTLWRRGLVRRADERGLSPPVSQGTGGVSKGDSVPLRGQAPSGAQKSFPDTPRPSGTPAPDW